MTENGDLLSQAQGQPEEPLEGQLKAQRVYSVSHLNLEAQGLLEGGFPLLWVEGEISNLARPASGHLYLTLKDDRAEVKAAMFRGRNRLLRFQPRDGMQVLVRARVTLYIPRGSFQLVIEHMEESGEGQLRRAFEQLRARLQDEGLFATERKRALPSMPRRIGVITSPTGAAVRDILRVLRRRCPQIPVLLYPSAVQGSEAPGQLRAALALANRRRDCDLLILARGGGSLEDLQAFNDEALVREVAASELPVISAVGHESDIALTDLAADLRAPTPSAAAEQASPDIQAFAGRLAVAHRRLARRMEQLLATLGERLHGLQRRLVHPEKALQQHAQRLDELEGRLQRQWQRIRVDRRQRLEQLERRLRAASPAARLVQLRQRLESLHRRLPGPVRRNIAERRRTLHQLGQRLHTASPLATLERGYSISLQEDHVISSVEQVDMEAPLRTRLADGELESRLIRVMPHREESD